MVSVPDAPDAPSGGAADRSEDVTVTGELAAHAERPPTKRTEMEDAHPAAKQVLTEETAIRPADDMPHPAERASGGGYVFARFDEGGGDDATSVDPRSEFADVATNIIPDLPRDPFLECVRGKDLGRVFPIGMGTMRVGRALDGDIVLSDVSVSRKHFSLDRDATGVRLRDHGSGNGTKVNDARTSTSTLAHGDLIVCGETELAFRVPGVVDAQPRAASGRPLVGPGSGRPDPRNAELATVPMGQAHPGASPVMRARARWSAWWTARWTKLGAKERRVAIGAAAALGLMLVVAVLASVLGGPSKDEILADEAANRGALALEAYRWKEAREAFALALTHEPAHEAAQRGQLRADQALADESRIDAARAQIASGELAAAEAAVGQVLPGSPLGDRADAVRAELAKHRALEGITAQFEQAIADGKTEQAARLVEEARGLGVALARVDALAERLRRVRGGKAEPRPGREVPAPKPSAATGTPVRIPPPDRGARSPKKEPERFDSPKPVSGALDDLKTRALALYAKQDFAGAADLIRSGIGKKTSSAAEALASLADRIDRYARLDRELPSLKGVARTEALRSAVLLDRGISGGIFAKRMEGALLDGYVQQADAYEKQGNDFRACETIRQASAVKASDPRVAERVRDCEERAADLVDDGESASADEPGKARDLFRKAMLMVPPSSKVYQLANKRLTALSRSSAPDDDE